MRDSHLSWERCRGEVSPSGPLTQWMDSLALALRRSKLLEFAILKGPSDMMVKQNNESTAFPEVKDSIYRARGYFISVRQAE